MQSMRGSDSARWSAGSARSLCYWFSSQSVLLVQAESPAVRPRLRPTQLTGTPPVPAWPHGPGNAQSLRAPGQVIC